MMAQYLSIKNQHRDAILFYRMGDFYEMFYEDAITAAKVLELALTSRNKKAEDPVEMCGFPVRAVDGYIARLIHNGYKIAICEQVEDPAEAKGLVKREVVRIITPGMIIDDQLLDEKSNNYIIAVAKENDTIGLASLDISTGKFKITESGCSDHGLGPEIIDEIARIAPSEAILPQSFADLGLETPLKKVLTEKSVSYKADKLFNYLAGRDKLIEQFKTRSLEGFGCESMEAGIAAAGALLTYVLETQKQQVSHLTGIETYHLGKQLVIDSVSYRNLEILHNLHSGGKSGTLLAVMDHTVTAMGGRLLKNWLQYPLIDEHEIESRLDAVEEAKRQHQVRHAVRHHLKSISDLERLGGKLSVGRANARDLLALKRSLLVLPGIRHELSRFGNERLTFNRHSEILNQLAVLIDRAIRDDAPPVLTDGGIIKNGFNAELDELIQISRDGKGWLARLEMQEKAKTGISSLKVKYNKVFGYFIEVSKAASASVPQHYIRKQTLVNAERYITDELKSFETKVLGAEDRRATLEYELFNKVRQEILQYYSEITEIAAFLAELDGLLNLAEIADHHDYVRPEINTSGNIYIKDGRHPVVETTIAGERYIPNTIQMDNERNQILIITGPNMAGKSTVLRQVALTVLMAQIGSFVPAGKASICLTDRIFTRVGALDNLSRGQSTFMVEMEETANIMNNATCRSLIVMDEIGRGTSTFDGLSIAWAVAEFLHDLMGKGVKTLFATHYHELTELAVSKSRVKNFNIAVKECDDQIIFLRKLVAGGTNRSYGIQVAQLAGVPAAVIQRAKAVLADIEHHQQDGHFKHWKKGFSDKEASLENRQLGLFDSGTCPASVSVPPRTKIRKVNHQPVLNDNTIIRKLGEIDISSMTPLDALNLLNELKEQAQAIKEA